MGQACAERWRPRLSGWASRGAASSSMSRARAPRPVSSRRATAPTRRRRKVQAMVSEGGGGTTSVSVRELLLRCPQCGATTSGGTTQFRCACGTPFDLPDASFEPAGEAAQAGLPALVFLPGNNVASGKLAQSIAYGARRVSVAGDFDDAMRQVEVVAGRLGIYLLNSINPYRLAGQRSIAYELLHQLNWQAPDWLVLPAGNLGNTSAIGAALLRAAERGLIARVPRLAGRQAARARPFYPTLPARWRELGPDHASPRVNAVT